MKVEQTSDLNPEELSLFNIIYKRPMTLFYTFISAFFYVLANTLFYTKANIISTGFVGFAQAIIYLNKDLIPYFSLIMFGFNIPLLLLFYKRLPLKFLLLTFYWLVFQIISQVFLELTGMAQFLGRLSIFDVNVSEPWDFNNPTHNQNWPIFVYGLMGGVLAISSAAFAWKKGGSSGGIDIIVAYYVRKFKMPVGKVNLLFALSCGSVAILINFLLSDTYQDYFYSKFFSRLATTLFVVVMSGWLFNLIYPKYKKILLKIYSTNKIQDIIQRFKDIDYWHAYNIVQYSTRFREGDSYIETSCLYLESKEIIGIVQKVDPKVFIAIQPVVKVVGRFNTVKID